MIITAGVLLYRYRRPHYYRLRNTFLVTGAVGLVVFALFPVAPPRLTDLPLVDTVTQGAEGYRRAPAAPDRSARRSRAGLTVRAASS